jgi:hypothetical protein
VRTAGDDRRLSVMMNASKRILAMTGKKPVSPVAILCQAIKWGQSAVNGNAVGWGRQRPLWENLAGC